MHDAQMRLAGDLEVGVQQQVVVPMDRAGQAVFDGSDAAVGVAAPHRLEHLLERWTGDSGHLRAHQSPGGGFAECSAFSLIVSSHCTRKDMLLACPLWKGS